MKKMKKTVLFTLLIALMAISGYAQVAINTTGDEPDSSAILDLQSTSKGFLVPRVTTVQRHTIVTTQGGLLVYDSDTESFWYYNSTLTAWQEIGAMGEIAINDLSDAISNGSRLFIGTNAGINNMGAYNIGIGYESMKENTTGSYNTALGPFTLDANVNGVSNSAFGYLSLSTNYTGSYNTGIGYEAMQLNYDGLANTAVGSLSMQYNSSGSYNTAIGRAALQNPDGNNNTAVGYKAGMGLESYTFDGCVFLGYRAGENNTSSNRLYIDNSNTSTPLIGGDFSTDQMDINGTIKITGGTPGDGKVLTSDADGLASWQTPSSGGATSINDLSDATNDGTKFFMGTNAGANNTGSYNLGIGYEAMKLNTTGTHNTALGFKTLDANTEGVGNSAFGHGSLTGNTTGLYNTSIGFETMKLNSTGAYNTALGSRSLDANTEGNRNSAFGYGSLTENTTGDDNTSIGYDALSQNTTGIENVAVGKAAGYNSEGDGNIFIGTNAGYNETGDNKLYIDNSNTTTPLIGGDFSTNQVDINGTLKITGGSPGANKVLTSDASGNATWQDVMQPIAFGTVYNFGQLYANSGNVSVTRTGKGEYSITISGENYVYYNYICNATLVTTGLTCGFISSDDDSNKLIIHTRDSSGNPEDFTFSFVVYKP